MVDISDIFRRYGPEYIRMFGERMLPSHKKAIWNIIHCRTEEMGGHLYVCDDCGEYEFIYHSCRNRHCPNCMNNKAEEWLEKQKQLLLPVHYHFVTFTLPSELRKITRSNQKLMYGILFRTSAAALKKLAADPTHVGGKIGMTGALHTWKRDMLYHPHTHFIVPGVGFDAEKNSFNLSHLKFFVPVKALSKIFRAKFRDELKKRDKALFNTIPSRVWRKDWVVYSKAVGNGEHAFEYLAAYVYRVAISNNRILKLENDMVTFRYRESKTKKWKISTIHAFEFIRRFCMHILPRGFVKVRHYGFLGPACRKILNRLRYLISAFLILMFMPNKKSRKEKSSQKVKEFEPFRCRHCGGKLRPVIPIELTARGPPDEIYC